MPLLLHLFMEVLTVYISELKSRARDALRDHWGTAILISLIFVAISYIAGNIPYAGWITPVFAFGFAAFYLSVIRGEEAKIEFLFTDSFSNFLKKWGTSLLKILYLVLWYLLFIIPGIVKTYSYAMTEYILLDNPEMGCNEAITKSREMMDGYKWKLFLLDLSFIGWRILSFFTCGLLDLLYVTPYAKAARAQFYQELKKIRG